ncbi:hypothetical protein [Lentibacillus cibarius]|uniref:Uncharacterized protein n=1 Tax=Lentibacillus cibarius TaxID=2583219 RepID=A0A5S3R7H6_9BACI|nr:hypothetical protein [Lentibacillus cibarius]TMN21823.1 hypothetical protein FFL34_06635 [Lentibacillus cibarius]
MGDKDIYQYHTSPLRRLENNHYALKNAYHRLEKAIDLNHDQEIYAATGEVLLWVMTTNEWHQKHNKGYKPRRNKHENGQILSGLLHAYNSMKHNMDFIKIHKKEGGFSFPISFPLEIPPLTVHWMKAGEILEGKWPDQKKNYEKYIENKEIMGTFKLAIDYLNDEYKYVSK